MVKSQNPNPQLQRSGSRAMQVKTPITELRPIKCHKCSFAASGFSVLSFCLEVGVFDRSGKKKLQNSVFEWFFLERVFCRKKNSVPSGALWCTVLLLTPLLA